MFGSAILEVAIGLVFVYLLMSVICSGVGEWWASWTKLRSRLLRQSIVGMLRDERVSDEFFKHPLIASQSSIQDDAESQSEPDEAKVAAKPEKKPTKPRPPSYIPAELFADVLIDLLARGTAGRVGATIEQIRDAISRRSGDELNAAIRPLLASANGAVERAVEAGPPEPPVAPIDALKTEVCGWYDRTMDRVSGEYKRRSSKTIFCVAAVIVCALNIDSVAIVSSLARNDTLRAAMVELAADKARTPATQPQSSGEQFQEMIDDLSDVEGVGLPLGWHVSDLPRWPGSRKPVKSMKWSQQILTADWWAVFRAAPLKLAGLLLTIVASSFGAPFWFDLLNKLVNLRSAGAKPKSPDSNGGSKPSTDDNSRGAAPRRANRAIRRSEEDTGMAGINNNSISFDLGTAGVLATLAKLAYETDEAKLTTRLSEAGFSTFDSFDEGTTQAFVAVSDDNIVVAFRGTEKNIGDWMTDANVAHVPGPFTGSENRVHKGFAGGLGSVDGFSAEPGVVESQIVARLDELTGRGHALWLTGHSLGAALATLLAARLRVRDRPAIHGVYTFGSPRVGDAEFARRYDAVLGDRTFRFVNHQDIVPRVPLRLLKYDHVGTLKYFDGRGNLRGDRAWWLRALNTVVAVFDGSDKKWNEVLHELGGGVFGDHSMERYEELVHRAG